MFFQDCMESTHLCIRDLLWNNDNNRFKFEIFMDLYCDDTKAIPLCCGLKFFWSYLQINNFCLSPKQMIVSVPCNDEVKHLEVLCKLGKINFKPIINEQTATCSWCCSQHEVIFLSFTPMFVPGEGFKFTYFQPNKLPRMLMSWLALFTLMRFQ